MAITPLTQATVLNLTKGCGLFKLEWSTNNIKVPG